MTAIPRARLLLAPLGIALCLAPSAGAQPASADSVYSTPALRALVTAAAARNAVLPPGLDAYAAGLESEIALVGVRPDGLEAAVSIEQFASIVRWRRPGDFEQHVLGYRAQTLGLQLSALALFRQSWAVPLLYGDRLALFFGGVEAPRRAAGDTADRPSAGRPPPVSAVHPLAADRERVYRFAGGDTIATIQATDRTIPIVRVVVEPVRQPPDRQTVLFRGELDIDAVRMQLVRMRGHFLTAGGRPSLATRLLRATVQAIAYVELVNAEIDGRYWLPSYQRIEAQVAVPVAGDGRSAFRVISRFTDYRLNGDTTRAASLAQLDAAQLRGTGDTGSGTEPRIRPHRLSIAPSDSLAGYHAFAREIGATTTDSRATDFDDVAPDVWRPTGPPRLDVRVQNPSDLFRFNRVEGTYTGVGAQLRLRDAAPGLVVSGTLGWAWAERVARGHLAVRWTRDRWLLAGRLGRSLDNTNDFRAPLDSGLAFDALLGSQDDYDYVDRRTVAASLTRLIGDSDGAIPPVRLRLELGAASDQMVRPHVTRGLVSLSSGFRANRGVTPGRYLHTLAALDIHPEITGEFLQTGIGATLRYERADGTLDWQRLEARLTARRAVHDVTIAARADAGAVLGRVPPQQLFELGSTQGLPGYGYKEFAGDRAALLHGLALYTLPVLRAPLPLIGRFFLPAPAPSIGAGIHAGWTNLASDRARRALALLGESAAPAVVGTRGSRPTGGIRATIDIGLHFFGGGVGLAAARAVDHRAPWVLVFSLGQRLAGRD